MLRFFVQRVKFNSKSKRSFFDHFENLSTMYIPLRVDFHDQKINVINKKEETCHGKTKLGRKRKLPDESTAIFEIKDSFTLITLLCPMTLNMELANAGSSNISFLHSDYNATALPTQPTDIITTEHVKEYIAREIFHWCRWDNINFGPFHFIYEVASFLKRQFANIAFTLSATTNKKIKDFLDRLVPDDFTSAKQLLEHIDSHITISGRWYQMIKSFQLFKAFDAHKDIFEFKVKSHSTYQTSCSYH